MKVFHGGIYGTHTSHTGPGWTVSNAALVQCEDNSQHNRMWLCPTSGPTNPSPFTPLEIVGKSHSQEAIFFQQLCRTSRSCIIGPLVVGPSG